MDSTQDFSPLIPIPILVICTLIFSAFIYTLGSYISACIYDNIVYMSLPECMRFTYCNMFKELRRHILP